MSKRARSPGLIAAGDPKMVRFDFAFNNATFADRELHLEVSAPEQSSGDMSVKVEKLHVSSVLLAAHSDYFMTLYSNGMSESSSGIATVQVTEEERRGLMDLIQYMYTGRLVEPPDTDSTITLLTLADRFAISSCMEPLANVLKSFPSSLKDCLLILGLPESLKGDKAVQPVVEQCRSYLAQQFHNIPQRKVEFLALNMEGVKVVLDSDSLSVSYEEEVFQFLLEWLEANFHTLEERVRAAVEVAVVVRFPWMTGDFLVDIVSTSPELQTAACQELITEALKFKSFTHSRQQQMIWKKTGHNRYRPRNNAILENFWGSSKTFISQQDDGSCQVFFEFPLEMVICTGASFHSRPFTLGDKYTFNVEARHAQTKASYNQQLTCCICLVMLPSSQQRTTTTTTTQAPASADEDTRFVLHNVLDYTISMKRDYSQTYDAKASGVLELPATEAADGTGISVSFNDFFSGWYVERGFSFPRWNLTINGPVFLRLDLQLKETRLVVMEGDGGESVESIPSEVIEV